MDSEFWNPYSIIGIVGMIYSFFSIFGIDLQFLINKLCAMVILSGDEWFWSDKKEQCSLYIVQKALFLHLFHTLCTSLFLFSTCCITICQARWINSVNILDVITLLELSVTITLLIIFLFCFVLWKYRILKKEIVRENDFSVAKWFSACMKEWCMLLMLSD